MFSVAIDGPSGAGKSTVARCAARKLGFVYVDTGALYRAVGLAFLRPGINAECENAVAGVLNNTDIWIGRDDNGTQRVYLNGEDVSEAIRAPEVSMAASRCSALPAVRDFLLDMQRDMAKSDNVIMDGRDIGTVVLPNADVKIFLTASPETRARRRYGELKANGADVGFDDVLKDLKIRDYNDSHRDVAPLRRADDAYLLETDNLDFEQTVDAVLKIINHKRK